MKKALIISYYWPPAGGPGVQRILKFAKYLPQYGWTPIVLTVENGEYPAYDPTLSKEVPDHISVFRTRTREPFSAYRKLTGSGSGPIPVGVLAQKKISPKARFARFIRLNMVVPDAKTGWIPFAVKEGQRIIDKFKPDVIFSSSPPPTVHLIAKKLACRNNIPWVADLRDPWSNIHYYQGSRCALTNGIDAALEKRILGRASAVTTVSDHFSTLILAPPEKIRIVPNGFDLADFPDETACRAKDPKLTLAYVGGLNANRFYPEFFVRLRRAILDNHLQKDNVRLILAGQIGEEILNVISSTLEGILITEHRGYVAHAEAIGIMREADLLLMFMEKVSNYGGHVPGKVFEYLMTGNYILGIGDQHGDVAKILLKEKGGMIADPDEDLKNVFKDIIERWRTGTLRGADPRSINEFSREKLTATLAGIFDTL